MHLLEQLSLPIFQIAHGIFFHGLDIQLYEEERYLHAHPGGTTNISDHWLSNETLENIRHEAALRSAEKLAVLSEWVQ